MAGGCLLEKWVQGAILSIPAFLDPGIEARDEIDQGPVMVRATWDSRDLARHREKYTVVRAGGGKPDRWKAKAET
jgi:hypothetical protein